MEQRNSRTRRQALPMPLLTPKSAHLQTGIRAISPLGLGRVHSIDSWMIHSYEYLRLEAILGKLTLSKLNQRSRSCQDERMTQHISFCLIGRLACDGATMWPKYWSLTPQFRETYSRSLTNFGVERVGSVKRMISESAMMICYGDTWWGACMEYSNRQSQWFPTKDSWVTVNSY